MASTSEESKKDDDTAAAAAAAVVAVSMESLLGPTLLGKEGKTIPTKKALDKKEFVLLYFSASWCPPCRAFSPVLKEFYSHVRDSVEIVYVASDKDYNEFTEYFGSMPWLSLPENNPAAAAAAASAASKTNNNVVEIKNKLATTCQVRGIPTLIVLEKKTGHFVTDQARNQIQNVMTKNPANATQAFASRELVQTTWKKETTKVPLSEAQFGQGAAGAGGGGGFLGMLVRFLFGILKNPINIFAMMYFFKLFMRKYKELTTGEADDDATAAGGGDDKEL